MSTSVEAAKQAVLSRFSDIAPCETCEAWASDLIAVENENRSDPLLNRVSG